jgi:glycosyltransferase involved in cell wall biosynthesis
MPDYRKLNVGVFTHDFYPFVGGQGRHIYELYKQNEIHKHVNMFVFSPRENSLCNSIALFHSAGRRDSNNILFSIKLNNAIEKIINTYQLDLVHIHSGPGGLFLLRDLDVPTIITSHHTYWQQFNYLRGQRWKVFLYYLERMTYLKASQIICVSPDTNDILSTKYKIDKNILHVIPNGIDVNQYINYHNSAHGKKEIIYVGRIDERKGVNFLINTFEILHKTNSNLILHIVGDGKDRIRIQNSCKRKGLNVIFHGFIPDAELESLYKLVALQVVPSVFEGFGMVVLEAMARGIPVIATNVDGIRSIIKDGYNGLLVDYGDQNALSKQIQYLLQNKDLSNSIINNASRELEKYNWEKIYNETIGVYRIVAQPTINHPQ